VTADSCDSGISAHTDHSSDGLAWHSHDYRLWNCLTSVGGWGVRWKRELKVEDGMVEEGGGAHFLLIRISRNTTFSFFAFLVFVIIW
jgi:hypothetical protein